VRVIRIGVRLSPEPGPRCSIGKGKIINLTTTTDGVMIILDTGVPTNCVNPYLGWMLIPTSYGAMASLTLSMWLRGDAHVTVYTTPTTDTYCAVNQVDPVEP